MRRMIRKDVSWHLKGLAHREPCVFVSCSCKPIEPAVILCRHEHAWDCVYILQPVANPEVLIRYVVNFSESVLTRPVCAG